MSDVSDLLRGIRDGLEVINAGLSLRSQTQMIRGAISPSEVDKIIGNSIVAIRKLSSELEASLKNSAD